MNSKLEIFAIAAVDDDNGLGLSGKIPWNIPEDMQHFKMLTMNHTVVMGRRTFESIGSKPLQSRLNVVITSKAVNSNQNELISCKSFSDFHIKALNNEIKLPSDKIWIIGGSMLYKATIDYCKELFLTKISGKFGADVFFPEFQSKFELIDEDVRDGFTFLRYKNISIKPDTRS